MRKLLLGMLSNRRFSSHAHGRINPYELFYVYSDLTKPEPFNQLDLRLLTTFQSMGTHGDMVTYVANPIQYKNLEKGNLQVIDVLIAGDDGKPIPFQRGPSIVTLHFVRKSPLRRF